MNDQTARFALPLIDPGQSQKEMTHNEALTLIDAAMQPCVLSVGLDTPPVARRIGDQWIVSANPSGDWAGHPHALAIWSAGGWRFVSPTEGMTVWSIADHVPARFSGGNWAIGDVSALRLLVAGLQVIGPRQPAIATPTGGNAIDAEARTAIDAILAAMNSHGLIA